MQGCSFVQLLQWQWDPSGCSELPGREWLGGESTHLVIHLLLHFQRDHIVCLWAQHIWAHADGQIAGVHPVGLSVLADVVEQREQVLEQGQVWPRKLFSHPAWTEIKRDVNSWCSSHCFFI